MTDTAQTPIDDLERAALAHYDELSSKACHWNSIIPQAIRFYFAAQRRPNPETQAVAQLEVRNGIAGLKRLLAPIDQVSDGMMLYRSPVEAVPPQQSAEPVGELMFRDGIVSFHTLMPIEQLHPGKVFYVAASPGPSALVEEMEKLEAELRDTAKDTAIHTMVRDQLIICADRLSALITRHRGKS